MVDLVVLRLPGPPRSGAKTSRAPTSRVDTSSRLQGKGGPESSGRGGSVVSGVGQGEGKGEGKEEGASDRQVIGGSVNYSITKPVDPDQVGSQIFASTDDGTMLSWNINGLRQQSEDNFRVTHKSALSRPHVRWVN